MILLSHQKSMQTHFHSRLPYDDSLVTVVDECDTSGFKFDRSEVLNLSMKKLGKKDRQVCSIKLISHRDSSTWYQTLFDEDDNYCKWFVSASRVVLLTKSRVVIKTQHWTVDPFTGKTENKVKRRERSPRAINHF